jgi:5-methylcytosine-specific restriction endonuclease McrA
MLNHPFYYSKAWRSVRLMRLHRAGWRCEGMVGSTRCNKDLHRERKPPVHHVHEPHVRPDLALDVTNLRALCQACHNAMHDRMHGRQHVEVGADGYPMDGVWAKPKP